MAPTPAEKQPPDDPTLHTLMEQTFGPPDGATEEDRLARGLEQVARLSQPDGEASEVKWLHESPPLVQPPPDGEPRCFRCGAAGATASCVQCKVAIYCNKECQRLDWKSSTGAFGGHKGLCARYKLLGRAMCVPAASQRALVSEVLGKARLYLCPFALHHAEASGGGFLFVQSECTLAELALPAPRDCHGSALTRPRSLVLQHMALEEYAEFCAHMGGAAQRQGAPSQECMAAAVAARGEEELVLLLRTGCGMSAALLTPVVPELRVCRTLAADYAGKEALQLDLDEL